MKTLICLFLIACLPAMAQNPISVRTTNGVSVNLTDSGGLAVSGGLTSDTIYSAGAVSGYYFQGINTASPGFATFFNGSTAYGGFDATNLSAWGNGSELSNLNASQLSSGTVADGRLSANVALLNENPQSFTGAQNNFVNSSNSGVLNVAGASGFGGAVQVTHDLTSGHYVGGGSTPTVAYGVGGGTPTASSIVGTDSSFSLSFTTPSGLSTTGLVWTVTFARPFASAPRVLITEDTGSLLNDEVNNGLSWSKTSTTTTVSLSVVNASLSESNPYKFTVFIQQ